MTKANAILLACASHVLVSLADGFFKEPLYKYSPLAFWVFDFAKFVVVPVFVLVWLWRSHSILPRAYGLRSIRGSDGWFVFGTALFLCFLLYFFYIAVSHIAWRIFPSAPPSFTYGGTVPDGLLHYPVALYFGLTAGFVEEISFRALPLLYIKERFGEGMFERKYVVVTSLLFAMVHWENGVPEIFATFAFGVAASLLYLKLRDLWPLIGAHALADVWEFS